MHPTRATLGSNAPPLRDPVAIYREGNCFLLAERADVEAKNGDGLACVHDLDTDELTPTQWLQIWGKWFNWEPTTDAEYRAALRERRR